MPPQPEDPRPLVVLLTLDIAAFYNDMYRNLNNLLERHAKVPKGTTASVASSFFNSNGDVKPTAILAADESLNTRAPLLQEAASYVRSGGTLIFMGLFSSFTRPSEIKLIFSKLDLPPTDLSPGYSQKALHVANVQQSDAVYLPSNESRTESLVFSPTPVGIKTEAPVAFAQVGQGKVGYVGDVNNEDVTLKVVFRMCGIGV